MTPFSKALLEWFAKEQRKLPWREGYDPYAVWISEVMLQQTQVQTVLPYFARWMKELPRIEDLAACSEDRLLKLWEGLGYYSRALNLKKAAQKVIELYGGKLPARIEELRTLSGIGPYTAAAIASIAFQQDEVVLDGNVMRVLSRVHTVEEPINAQGTQKKLLRWAQKDLPNGKAREYNQALMELGALICTPKRPECGKCPVNSFCKAYKTSQQEAFPLKLTKQKPQEIQVAIAILHHKNKFFIQKRPSQGLMAGLWEFPGGKVEPEESPESALKREIQEELGFELREIQPFMNLKHSYTRFKVHLFAFLVEVESIFIPHLQAAQEGKWVKKEELRNYPFPAANKRLLERLLEL